MNQIYSKSLLEVITGPMFSGKSNELIRRAEIFLYGSIETIIFKPSFDNRFSEKQIVSRNGLTINAHSVNEINDIKKLIKNNHNVIIFDEIQFFEKEIIAYIRELLSQGKHVIACGLDTDFKREPFEITASLMAIAEIIKKLKAVCSKCKNLASFSFRKIKDNDLKVLGDYNEYEPMCRSCHIESSKKYLKHEKK